MQRSFQQGRIPSSGAFGAEWQPAKDSVGDIADVSRTDEQELQSSNHKRLGEVRDLQGAAGLEQEDEPFHAVVAAGIDLPRFQGGLTGDGS